MIALYKALIVPGKQRLIHILINICIVILFAIIYWSMGTSEHFTFKNNAVENHLTPISALYFAFSNHLTIGYGDIIPHSTLSRCISMFQFMCILIYLFLAAI